MASLPIVRPLLALTLLTACSRPAPATPHEPVVVLAAEPIGVEHVDRAAFLAMLKREDWSAMIDPEIGLVALTDRTTTAGRRDQTHQIDLHRFCSHQRAALAAKFEALDLAAALIADDTTREVRCLGFQHADEPSPEIECHYDGRLKNFRFARRGARYVLIGVATVGEGEISIADELRYEDALKARCDPRDRTADGGNESVDDQADEEPPPEHQPDPSLNSQLE